MFSSFETITVELRKGGLAFDVHLPEHFKARPEEYAKKVKKFMASAPQAHEVDFEDLVLRSKDTSLALSEILSPTKRPIYLEFAELGMGGFGRVYKAVNASTGLEYAGNEFSMRKSGRRKLKSEVASAM